MSIPDRAYQIAIAALLAAVVGQQIRVSSAHVETAVVRAALADTKNEHATVLLRIADLTKQALRQSLETLAEHAKAEQENENAYRKLQAAAAASAVSERAAVQQLRDNSAAFGRVVAQPGETCPDFSQRVGDRLAAVNSLADEGDGLLQEARELVRRRDSEIVLLLGQIEADRAALSSSSASTTR